MLTRLLNTEINRVNVVIRKGCQVIIKTDSLRAIIHQEPSMERPIFFGVSFEIENQDPKDSAYYPCNFNRDQNTLNIDATTCLNPDKNKRVPKIFKIKIPDGCDLFVNPKP